MRSRGHGARGGERAARKKRIPAPPPGLPADALHDCARATWIGQGALLVEGQHGVMELGSKRIRLKTGTGVLTILGDGLALSALSADAAAVSGQIETLTYGRADRKGE